MKIVFLLLNAVFIVCLIVMGAAAEDAHRTYAHSSARELLANRTISEDELAIVESQFLATENRGANYTRIAFAGAVACGLNALFILVLPSPKNRTVADNGRRATASPSPAT